MISKWLRHLRESFLRMGPSRAPTEVAVATLANKCPYGGGSWARMRKSLWRKVCHRIRNTMAFMNPLLPGNL